MEYVSGSTVRKTYEISGSTLRTWADTRRVGSVRTPGGKRLYRFEDIKKLLGDEGQAKPKDKVCYARVSSAKQKGDLERQVKELKECYPNHRIISDIGSGINYKRKGLKTLLDLCLKEDIDEIVVTHKDRLCRFGFELFEQIFKRTGVKFVVHSNNEIVQTKEEELAEDLLSLVTVFVAKNNGLRAAENRRRRAQNKKNKIVSDKRRKEEDQ